MSDRTVASFQGFLPPSLKRVKVTSPVIGQMLCTTQPFAPDILFELVTGFGLLGRFGVSSCVPGSFRAQFGNFRGSRRGRADCHSCQPLCWCPARTLSVTSNCRKNSDSWWPQCAAPPNKQAATFWSQGTQEPPPTPRTRRPPGKSETRRELPASPSKHYGGAVSAPETPELQIGRPRAMPAAMREAGR